MINNEVVCWFISRQKDLDLISWLTLSEQYLSDIHNENIFYEQYIIQVKWWYWEGAKKECYDYHEDIWPSTITPNNPLLIINRHLVFFLLK